MRRPLSPPTSPNTYSVLNQVAQKLFPGDVSSWENSEEHATIPLMDAPAGTPTSQKIVIVEDNAALAEIYKTRLELLGYTCFIGYNGITGLYFIQKEIPDLVLLDLMIPDIPGDQVLRTLRGSGWGRDIKVLIISNLNESEAAVDLRQLGIEGYLVKANMNDDTLDLEVNKILRPVPTTKPA